MLIIIIQTPITNIHTPQENYNKMIQNEIHALYTRLKGPDVQFVIFYSNDILPISEYNGENIEKITINNNDPLNLKVHTEILLFVNGKDGLEEYSDIFLY
jgi:hypothetical protein